MPRTLDIALSEGATPREETVLCHTTTASGNTLEARVIIAIKDTDGGEWVVNSVRKFKFTRVRPVAEKEGK